MKIKNDILNCLYENEKKAVIPQNYFFQLTKACNEQFNKDLKKVFFRDDHGNQIPFEGVFIYIFLRKMLNENFKLPPYRASDFSKEKIYLVTLLKVFDLISVMEGPPVKTTLRLMFIFFEIYQRAMLIKLSNRDNNQKMSATEKTFTEIKKHLHTGMTDREIKNKIFEISGRKDPKTWKKYLEIWRSWERQLFETTK